MSCDVNKALEIKGIPTHSEDSSDYNNEGAPQVKVVTSEKLATNRRSMDVSSPEDTGQSQITFCGMMNEVQNTNGAQRKLSRIVLGTTGTRVLRYKIPAQHAVPLSVMLTCVMQTYFKPRIAMTWVTICCSVAQGS